MLSNFQSMTVFLEYVLAGILRHTAQTPMDNLFIYEISYFFIIRYKRRVSYVKSFIE